MIHQKLPKPMKDDPLEVFLVLMGLHQRKNYHLVKAVTGVCSIYMLLFHILGMVDVISNEGWKTAFHYVPCLFVELTSGSVGAIWVFFHNESLFDLHDKLKRYFWCINSCGEKIRNRIFRERKSALVIYFIVMIQIVIGMISVIPFVGDEEDIYFAFRFYRKFFGIWSIVFTTLHAISMFIVCHMVHYLIITSIYIVYHGKFQFYLLRGYMYQVLTKPTYNGVDTCMDQMKYQDMIYKNLSVCAQQYSNIRHVTKIMFTLDISVLVVSTLGAASLVTGFYFVVESVSPSSNFRVTVFMIGSVSVLSLCCICGQMIIDESDTYYVSLTNCPWIYWNKKNRLAYLLLLVFAQTPISPKCYALADVNYAYILFFTKTVYSLAALCIKLS